MFNIPREGRCWLPVFAHRFSWELSFGKIPAVAHVVSTCGNKLCVNPEHLYLWKQLRSKSFGRKVKKTEKSCWIWTGAKASLLGMGHSVTVKMVTFDTV